MLKTLTLPDMITGHPGRDPNLANTLTLSPYGNGTGIEFVVSDSHGLPNAFSLDYAAARELRDCLTAWLES